MVEHESATVEVPRVERPRRVRALLRGAWTGVRWGSFFARPFVLVLGLLFLIPTACGLGAGYGLGVHSIVFNAGGLYLAFLGWGLILGTLVSCIGLFRRPRDPNRPPPWCARPIRLRPWRRAAPPDPRPRSAVWFAREARLTRWIVGLGLVPLVVAFGVGVYANRFVAARLAAALAEADRDVPNWPLDDLMAARRAVPDEENGAIVVAEVVNLLGGNWPPTPPREPGTPAPPLTALQRAFDHYPEPTSPARLDDETATGLRAALDEQGEAVALARTVANYRWGRHELDVQLNPLNTLLPETQNARCVARLLQVDAEVLAHEGQIDEALGSVRAIFGVARSIGDEPFLISGLVRIAISHVGRAALRPTLALGEASPEALTALQTVLLAERDDPMLLVEVRGERAILDALIRRIRDGELSIASLSGGASAASNPMASWGQLWFDHQRAVGLEWYNEAVRIAQRPIGERPALAHAWQAKFLQTKDSGSLSKWGAVLPLLLMPALDAWMTAAARNGAELGAATLLVAAERHRLKYGDWPATCGAIDPDILPEPPLDPFTDQPYRLERRDGQIWIYSVGPNRRDEHGACDYRKAPKGTFDDYGTAAWEVTLRRQPPPARPPEPSESPTP